jgi:hypothetical protein
MRLFNPRLIHSICNTAHALSGCPALNPCVGQESGSATEVIHGDEFQHQRPYNPSAIARRSRRHFRRKRPAKVGACLSSRRRNKRNSAPAQAERIVDDLHYHEGWH